MKLEVLEPTLEQLATLGPYEQRAFRLVDFVNSHPSAKGLAQAYLETVGMGWVYYCSRNLAHIIGTSVLDRLNPPAGLMLVSNHRSFFDQFFIACWLIKTTRLLERIYFPVRSEFWYDQPIGLAVSAVMSALCASPISESGSRINVPRS